MSTSTVPSLLLVLVPMFLSSCIPSLLYAFQESSVHGKGRFAAESLPSNYGGIPMEGKFVVFDTPDEAKTATTRDGVPRYAVCSNNTLSMLRAPHESVRKESALYLVPAPTCPLYNMKSSLDVQGRQQEPFFFRRQVLEKRHPRSKTDREKLSFNVGRCGIRTDLYRRERSLRRR